MSDSHPDSEFWSQARSQVLLDPQVINLNTGSFGPLPRVVFERVMELRRRLAEEPMDFLLRAAPPLLWQARERLTKLLGADPRRLVFTANVTAAINTIAASLVLPAPGEILLTDHEYGAMHWCWERAAQRQGLTLRTFRLPAFPKSTGEIVDAVRAAITDQTRLLFFSHVLSPTGLVLPAKEICEEARRRRVLTVIDGAHAVAMIPLDVNNLGCDFYTGNCHKWLLAPTGVGFLYFGPGSEDRLQPLQVSWGWRGGSGGAGIGMTPMDERDEYGSTPRLRAFEFEGTRDPCPWLTVPAAIDFQESLGWDRIRTRISQLAEYVRQRISQLGSSEQGMSTRRSLRLATPPDPALRGAMTAFWLPEGTDAVSLRRRLWEKHRIEIPIIERPEGLLIRVSTHFYNTEEEIDRLVEALITDLS
jgi:isopenicillin-N epimerase